MGHFLESTLGLALLYTQHWLYTHPGGGGRSRKPWRICRNKFYQQCYPTCNRRRRSVNNYLRTTAHKVQPSKTRTALAQTANSSPELFLSSRVAASLGPTVFLISEQKFSKVSALQYLLGSVNEEHTFENLSPDALAALGPDALTFTFCRIDPSPCIPIEDGQTLRINRPPPPLLLSASPPTPSFHLASILTTNICGNKKKIEQWARTGRAKTFLSSLPWQYPWCLAKNKLVTNIEKKIKKKKK